MTEFNGFAVDTSYNSINHATVTCPYSTQYMFHLNLQFLLTVEKKLLSHSDLITLVQCIPALNYSLPENINDSKWKLINYICMCFLSHHWQASHVLSMFSALDD